MSAICGIFAIMKKLICLFVMCSLPAFACDEHNAGHVHLLVKDDGQLALEYCSANVERARMVQCIKEMKAALE